MDGCETMTAEAAIPRIAVLIVAAGSGSRVADGDPLPKQYRRLGPASVLQHSVAAFVRHPWIAEVVVAIHPDHLELYQAAVLPDPKLSPPVRGAATRQGSVLAGLEALAATGSAHVLIHDAARPFVSAAIIDRTIAALVGGSEAVLVGVPVVDTLKKADAAGAVVDTVPRDGLWAAQTPQAFAFNAILADHRAAAAAGRADFTDDAGVAEWAGRTVEMVMGDATNRKLTTSTDIDAARVALETAEWARLADIRVGTGYDVHSFEPGEFVTLCGVEIPHAARLNGHSDADVALHALTDAILGALGDGDIGQHFPPSDQRWRGAPSRIFLEDAMRRLAARGGRLAHCDVSIIAEAPKVGPHREAMRARIADYCGITIDRVGVKATTNEKLGFVGRREGIAAIATATIRLPL